MNKAQHQVATDAKTNGYWR